MPLKPNNDLPELRNQIFELVSQFYMQKHSRKEFIPGKSKVHYSGRVFNEQELLFGVDSVLDFNLTAGHYAKEFESKMKSYFQASSSLLVNSGSSANLLMIATLLAEKTKNRLLPGDEVITPAVTFPTTLTPIIQNGLVPVFVDCKPGEYDVDPNLLEAAIGPRTKCIFVPHTVGIPCNMDVIMDVAKRHNLWVLEDGCDALGATWDGKRVGTFGAMSSISFYPAHHITMGEGGMVVVNDPQLRKTALSIRDWGRDCWCEPGVNDSCGKRFDWQLGDLPHGYDHKYIYSNLGYNLKVSEMQAAVGVAQLDKLESFIGMRRNNAQFYLKELARFEEHLILPTWPEKADPSWFGFPITLKNHIERKKFISWLEGVNIETRLVFGGNILNQPGFRNINRRISGNLDGTNEIMNKTLFIGVYPGLTVEMRQFVVDRIAEFFKSQI